MFLSDRPAGLDIYSGICQTYAIGRSLGTYHTQGFKDSVTFLFLCTADFLAVNGDQSAVPAAYLTYPATESFFQPAGERRENTKGIVGRDTPEVLDSGTKEGFVQTTDFCDFVPAFRTSYDSSYGYVENAFKGVFLHEAPLFHKE